MLEAILVRFTAAQKAAVEQFSRANGDMLAERKALAVDWKNTGTERVMVVMLPDGSEATLKETGLFLGVERVAEENLALIVG